MERFLHGALGAREEGDQVPLGSAATRVVHLECGELEAAEARFVDLAHSGNLRAFTAEPAAALQPLRQTRELERRHRIPPQK